jgi:hypothetical protein
MALPTHALIRRFLMHVLPKGLHRICRYGLFANGGAIEHAQQMAVHETPRTTKLYDRTHEQIS